MHKPKDAKPAPFPRQRRKLLIVDGDDQSAATMKALATSRDYETARATDASSAIEQCQTFAPDLALVVDLDMASPSAVRLSLHFLDVAKLPFLVYSASTELFDRVIALQIGADNFLPKPMDHRLLIAYIDALMRRVESSAQRSGRGSLDEFGPYRINRVNRSVSYQGNTVRLSGTEFELFWLLATRIGEIFDRRQLVASMNLSVDDDIGRAVDQRLFRLRARLSAAGAPKDAIRSVRGKGFVLTGAIGDRTVARSGLRASQREYTRPDLLGALQPNP